jgi:ribosomal protein L11 methyltransferase
MAADELIEIAVDVDPEAAEVVSELFNRYNGGGYEEDSVAGEASGGGAVVEATGLDDDYQPIPGKYRLVVKTYLKPGPRGQEIRRQLEEGLWRLSLIYPLPEPQIRTLQAEDWAHAWKKFYKPLRIGRRVVLKPSWEEFPAQPDDVIIELDPGMAFGTGLHPSTRLCVAALEEIVQPGDAVLDLGTGSGVLALVAAKLGARSILATDIDTLAVRVARENAERNGLPVGENLRIEAGSVPGGLAGAFQVIVANILAEVLVGLFEGAYGNPPLAEPLAPAGKLILSGILNERAQLVIDAAARHGLTLVDRKAEGDWVALVVQQSPVA